MALSETLSAVGAGSSSGALGNPAFISFGGTWRGNIILQYQIPSGSWKSIEETRRFGPSEFSFSAPDSAVIYRAYVQNLRSGSCSFYAGP